ncbi:hypothetical protein JCM3775_002913 [Rhodotorula graminis]|uniref:Glycosyltransferase family 17 protein n=1 Tax=Rhodotorula graminis (strain WP1) TaxID=578459 RepID=A0A194S8X9_RHOGW|nr:glycosyltransferase family 17 protein [Rhodotorula graminis WP1]KPV75861.1 glycosyltransferase family 17 protein [Rhodotorula graminis WP1]
MLARRVRPLHLVVALVALALVYAALVHPNLPRGYLAYSTRPLWDTSEAPTDVIPHYWADDARPDDLCHLHGWHARPHPVPQVWDATIFSTELDLLLVRLHELSPVVARFFILESDRTFTGLAKPRILSAALDADPRFKPYLPKITYRPFTGAELAAGESPFEQEIALRRAMTDLLRSEYPADPHTPPPVLLLSDVDEVPSRKTAALVEACAFAAPELGKGSALHLGMRSFLYSFEWEEGGETSSWRATAVEWPQRGRGSDEFYRHGKVTERVLANSGWHCSWCFRRLSDFATKATGYSHVDRLGSRPAHLLKPERIQHTICAGLDFFAMLPEAYTYRDLFNKLRLVPSKSATDIPTYVVEHADELRYLLPGEGNCIREDAPGRSSSSSSSSSRRT